MATSCRALKSPRACWSTSCTTSQASSFAKQLEKNEAVKVYAKLWHGSRCRTPLGTYNPDRAVLIEIDGTERLYFVVETKGSLFKDDLRS